MPDLFAANLISFNGDSSNATAAGPTQAGIQEILRTIRMHLGMEVAFLSEFFDGKRVFRFIDSDLPACPVQVGGGDILEDSYCQRVVDGRLPQLIRDAKEIPEARSLAVTMELPVGAHLSIPVQLSDGSIYGTFCCFSSNPDQTITERDMNVMRAFAQLATKYAEQNLLRDGHRYQKQNRIRAVLDDDNSLSMVYQPIYHVCDGELAGFESLSRFSAQPYRTPDVWFNEAFEVDLGLDLEMKAIRAALSGFDVLQPQTYLSINVSPETILSGQLPGAVSGFAAERIVLEITEHALIDHYSDLSAALRPLRAQGMRVAVDDAGAGYASFRHILNLSPDIIKLDISLTKNIDFDQSRRALAAAMIRFAQETNSEITAEGVETESELIALRQLGINKAQGYLLGKPMALAPAARLSKFIALTPRD
jgi:EAL domain-containing protein (putative c-di-GMP-specific phosphodiesterase class I)